MKDNRLEVKIARSIKDVFEFTINPNNTPLWLPTVREEVADSFPPIVGTIYKNRGDKSGWNTYKVIEIEPPRLFTLSDVNDNYICRYTYEDLEAELTRLEYYEAVRKGKLSDPFNISFLENLKRVMEQQTI